MRRARSYTGCPVFASIPRAAAGRILRYNSGAVTYEGQPMSRPAVLVPLLLLGSLGAPASGFAQAEVDVEQLYKKLVRSCVFIASPMKDQPAFGSGFLVDADRRLVLTSEAVVPDLRTTFVQFPIFKPDGAVVGDRNKYLENIPAGKALKGTIVFRDGRRGLALIQVDRLPENTPAVPLAAKNPSPGARTYNIGSPGAVPQLFSITTGMVRSVGVFEMLTRGREGPAARVLGLLTTNPLNPGDVGGPLVDQTGAVVGVTLPAPLTLTNISQFLSVEEVHALLKEARTKLEPAPPAVVPSPAPVAVVPAPLPVASTECPSAPRRCCILRIFKHSP